MELIILTLSKHLSNFSKINQTLFPPRYKITPQAMIKHPRDKSIPKNFRCINSTPSPSGIIDSPRFQRVSVDRAPPSLRQRAFVRLRPTLSRDTGNNVIYLPPVIHVRCIVAKLPALIQCSVVRHTAFTHV